jgi:hypothetical protein
MFVYANRFTGTVREAAATCPFPAAMCAALALSGSDGACHLSGELIDDCRAQDGDFCAPPS